MPGWVSMRKVSHLPPAKIISALTKAAPPLVSLAPLHSTVAAPAPPGSSSCISARACLLAGIWWATKAEANPCNVTPLARSTTSGGRSSYERLATNPASSRLNDMTGSFRLASRLRIGAGAHSDDHRLIPRRSALPNRCALSVQSPLGVAGDEEFHKPVAH